MVTNLSWKSVRWYWSSSGAGEDELALTTWPLSCGPSGGSPSGSGHTRLRAVSVPRPGVTACSVSASLVPRRNRVLSCSALHGFGTFPVLVPRLLRSGNQLLFNFWLIGELADCKVRVLLAKGRSRIEGWAALRAGFGCEG